MKPPTPVEPREVLEGHGTLSRNGIDVPVVAFRMERATYAARGEWRIEADLPRTNDDPLHPLLASGPGALTLRGETEGGRPVRVEVVHFRGSRDRRIQATAQEVALGEPRAGFIPTWQSVSVSLSPTPLARPETDFLVNWPTGEIKPHGRRRAKPTRATLATAVGDAAFSLQYAFEEADVDGERSLLRVPVPTLVITVERGIRTADIGAVTDRLAADLEDVLRIVSSLSRRTVRWRRMRVVSRRDGHNGPEHHEYERLRAVAAEPPGEGRLQRTPLVNPYRLPAEALRTVVDRFRSLPFKESATAAIVYLGAAQTAGTVDARLAFGFTALEALVSGTGEEDGSAYAMTSAAARALTTRLKPVIRTFGTEREKAEHDVDAVVGKLAELRRRSITNRLVDLVHRLGVEWTDLWAPGASLKEAFGASYSRRNRFVHAGHLGHVLQASVDGRRAVMLAERVLFRLVGGDTDWHDPATFEDARYLVEDERLVQSGAV